MKIKALMKIRKISIAKDVYYVMLDYKINKDIFYRIAKGYKENETGI